MNTEKILEIIKAQMKNLRHLALYYKSNGDEDNYERNMMRYQVFNSVIGMFEDEEFALNMAKIYGLED